MIFSKSLMNSVPDYIYFKDKDSRFLRINKAHAAAFGLSDPAEAVGKSDFDFFTKDHAQPAFEGEQEIIRTGKPIIGLVEKETRTDGSVAWVSTTKMPLYEGDRIVGTFGISRDITPQKLAEEVLDKERSLLNALMDNVPDYIYFKDLESRFIRINKAHARAFKLNDPSEAVGKSDFDFFTKAHAQPAFEDEQTIIRTGRPLVGLEEKETRADGRDSWVSTNKMPLRDVHGRIIGTFGVSRDITEQKRAELALRDALQALKKANEIAEKARAAAEAASQAKGMFLARMSHEIRTPMNSVIGFSDMLLDTEMSEEQVEFVRNITKSGEALLSLINEILDFSKIEAGQLTFQNIDFDLEITAFDVCNITQPRLGNKPVEVLCRVGDNLPGFIKSDPTRMRQVLLNLMSNAIKFTAGGGDRAGRRRGGGDGDAAEAAHHGPRHGDRHSEGQAGDGVRAVPAGRRLDHPEVRRDGSGAGHLPANRQDDGRGGLGGERIGQGKHLPFHRLGGQIGKGIRPRRPRSRPWPERRRCWSTTTKTTWASLPMP